MFTYSPIDPSDVRNLMVACHGDRSTVQAFGLRVFEFDANTGRVLFGYSEDEDPEVMMKRFSLPMGQFQFPFRRDSAGYVIDLAQSHRAWLEAVRADLREEV